MKHDDTLDSNFNKVICHLYFDEFPKDSRVRRYANSLLEREYKVIIICLGNGLFPKNEHRDNLFIYRINLKKRRGSYFRRFYEYLIFEFIAFFYSSYIFMKFRPRIYHVHTLPDFLVLSTIIPKIFGSKIILDFHELFPEAMLQFKKELKKSSIIHKVLLFQEKISFKFADKIIVFHHLAKEILECRYGKGKNIEVVMNGVDENEMPDFRKRKNEKFKIVYNGTINYNLNLSLILKALILLRENKESVFQDIEFNLYGDGPDLKNIIDLAKINNLRNVFYKGRLEFSDMMKELETASVCILPPIKDIYSDLFYSLKLIEMVYLKIPVVATKLDTYLKYYPEHCLIYFESNNEKELAEKIKWVYNNPEGVKLFTENAFNEYQKYSWNIMKIVYISLIKKLFLNNNS